MPAETRKLVKLWSEARSRGEECALATVVRVAGSSYRKPGARMLLTRGGQRVGTVSGGCLEGEVSRKIWWLTEQDPGVRDYSTSYDDDSQQSYGLGMRRRSHTSARTSFPSRSGLRSTSTKLLTSASRRQL